MKKRAAVAVVLACLVAALVAAPSASPSGMPPEIWKDYVKVRARLVTQVNAFMASYRSCARKHGFLTKSWGLCIEPELEKKYVPAMIAMDKVIDRAQIAIKTSVTDQCKFALLKYTTRNQRARLSAISVVRHAWAYKNSTRKLREERARVFVIDRNEATNARLVVNKVCAPS